MKKRIRSKKLISSLAISTLVLGLFVTTVINADETEITTEPENQEIEEVAEDEVVKEEPLIIKEEKVNNDVSVTTSSPETEQVDNSSLTRVDLTTRAFPDSSRPLEQAIIANYTIDGIDGSTPDGYISISEANAYTGQINLAGLVTTTGTATGIENFTSITVLNLANCQLIGDFPKLVGFHNLQTLRVDQNKLTSFHAPTDSQNLKTLWYFFNDFDSIDLGEMTATSLSNLAIGKAINADMSQVTNFTVGGSKTVDEAHVRVTGDAGVLSWDSVTSYYIINVGKNAKYVVRVPYIDETGTLVSIVNASATAFSETALMDNEGNIVIGATIDNVIDGKVVLPDGGTVITGDATYTFDGNTIISETEITTEGNVITEKHITDGSAVDLVGITTETNNSNGETITIDLSDTKGTTTLKPGSIVTNNDGDKVYISDEATMDNEGNITSSGTYVTVTSDKTATTNSDGTITLPENSTVTVNGEDTIYPGTIIFSPEDGSLKYNPVSDLLNKDGNNLGEGITQKDIDDARTIVDGLTEGNLKDQLTEIVDTAQNILNAKDAVEDLFTDETHTSIPEDLTQADIDNAQNLVNKVPDGPLKDELQKDIDKAQDMLNARDKVNDLFTDETHTNIPEDLTQTDIDDAQKAVDKLPSGDLKDELQKEIDKAQDMLNARDKVNDLFTDNAHTDIPEDLTQKDIDKAQDAVDKLPNGDLKDELQKEIDKAQDMLNAKDAVGDLLDKDGNLYSDVTQKDIDKAQDLVNKLPEGELKDELQAVIDEAQRQLDAQNKKNPSTIPDVVKPNVSGGATTGGSTVNTADTTNTAIYFSLLVSSIALLGLFFRRRKTSK